MKTILFGFQLDGVSFLLSHPRALLADEMGLGKMIQTLGLIDVAENVKRILVICPASLTWVWKEKYMLEIDERRDAQIERFDVLSFEAAVKCSNQNFSYGHDYDLIVLDEAQAFKNLASKRTQAIHQITKNAPRVIATTGTPFENKPLELFSLLWLLDMKGWMKEVDSRVLESEKADRYGDFYGLESTACIQSMHEFGVRYCGAKRKVINWPKFKAGAPGGTAWNYDGHSNEAELGTKLRNTIMLRRKKDEVLHQLPPKFRTLTVVDKAAPNPILDSLDITFENYEERIKLLRTSKVLFSEWSKTRHAQALAKVPKVIEHVERRLESGEKLILFAHHEDVILALKEAIEALGTRPAVLVGSTLQKDREFIVHRFQEDERCRVFLGSIRAAGVGLTLTAARYVGFVELDPNPAAMTQGEDRAHRIGQKSHVYVEHFIVDGTLDARIAKILVRKQNVFNAVLDVHGWEKDDMVSSHGEMGEGEGSTMGIVWTRETGAADGPGLMMRRKGSATTIDVQGEDISQLGLFATPPPRNGRR